MAEQSKTLSEPETDTVEYTEEEQASAEEAEKENEEELGFFENIANNIQHEWNEFVDGITGNDSNEDNDNTEESKETVNDENQNEANSSQSEEASNETVEETAQTEETYGEKYHTEKKQASEMSEEELAQAQEDLYNREKWDAYGTKTEQHGELTNVDENGNRFDLVENGKDSQETTYLEQFGGTVSYSTSTHTETISVADENNMLHDEQREYKTKTVHYEGELGTFDYNADEWALALKTVTDEETGVSTQIPVLQYIQDVGVYADGENIEIPEGLKSLDYSFEGSNVISIPALSGDSALESVHGAFQDCQQLEHFSESAVEKDTASNGFNTGLAGLASGALVGASVGSVVPIVGNIIGGIGGAAAGFVLGQTLGSGYGGVAYMPDSIIDASDMFTGDEKLSETYASYGASCADVTSIYDGCTGIGNTATHWWTMLENVTLESNPNGTQSNIAPQSSQNAYTDTDSMTAITGTGWSSEYNDEEMDLDAIHENSSLSEEEANEIINHRKIEQLNAMTDESEIEGVAARSIADGELDTGSADYAAYTRGVSTQAVTKDDEGNFVALDTAADQIEDAKTKEDEEDGWTLNSLIDRAGMSVLEYGVAKLITKSTIGSIAIVAAGQFIKIGDNSLLPTSMTSILDTVSGWLGDSSAGQALGDLSNYLKGTSESEKDYSDAIKTAEEYQAAEDAKKTYQDDDDHTMASMETRINYGIIQKGMNVITVSGTADEIENESLANLMHASGKSVAQDNVLLTADNTPEDEYTGITALSEVQAQMMKDKIQEWANEDSIDGKSLSDEHKAECLEEFTNIMVGYDAYSQGLMDGIEEESQTTTVENFTERSINGANKVIQASACPFLDMMKEMNEQYDILPSDNYLDGYTDENGNTYQYNLCGINSFSNYEIGSGIAYVSESENEETEEAENETDDLPEQTETSEEQQSVDEATEQAIEESGIEDESSENETDEESTTHRGATENQNQNSSPDNEKNDKKSYGDIAEDTFAETMQDAEDEEVESQYRIIDASLAI